LIVSNYHADPEFKTFLKHTGFNHIEFMGSAIKYCKIADGDADLSIRVSPLMIWDIAAADCILREAGGKVTNFLGDKITYVKDLKLQQGIVASNKFLHKQVISLMSNI